MKDGRRRLRCGSLTAVLWLADTPPSTLPSQTYLEIFIYCLVFFIAVTLTAMAVACRLCCAPKKADLSGQYAVQKLGKSISMRRQVGRPSVRPAAKRQTCQTSSLRCRWSRRPPSSRGRV